MTWLLFRQDEVLAGRQARQHLTGSAVRHRLRSGRWRRVHARGGGCQPERAAAVHHQRPVPGGRGGAGLPEPNRQHRRRDASGRVRYLDVYYERWRVHVDVRAHWADMARQNDLWIAGDRVLRFPGWFVRGRPADVIAQVRQALLAAGWRPRERR